MKRCPLNLLLITIGSSGDVHPFIGIGAALRDRGHRVAVAANDYFEPAIRKAALEFIALGTAADFLPALDNPDLWHPRRGFKYVAKEAMLRGMRPTYEIIEREQAAGAAAGEPLVVVAHVVALGARVAQEKLGVPLATVILSPAILRSVHLPPVLPGLWMPQWMPHWVKRNIFAAGDKWVIDPVLAPEVNAFRKELGLEAVRGIFDWWNSPERVLGLFPDWFARPQPDWPAQAVLTGFPLFDEGDAGAPTPGLAGFLGAGPPPVVFTAGSAMKHGARFFAAAVEACRRMKRRGVLLAKFAGQIPAGLPETVRHFAYVPFSEILPRAAAFVHHGGIGTCAQGLRAGVPQVVTPLSHDQFDNAARLKRLGVGRSIRPRKFTGASAARALQEMLGQPEVASACRGAQGLFAGYDPIARTCEVVEAMGAAKGALGE